MKRYLIDGQPIEVDPIHEEAFVEEAKAKGLSVDLEETEEEKEEQETEKKEEQETDKKEESGNQQGSTDSATVEQTTQAQTPSILGTESSSEDISLEQPSFEIQNSANKNEKIKVNKSEIKKRFGSPNFLNHVKAGRINLDLSSDKDLQEELSEKMKTYNEATDAEGNVVPFQSNEEGKRKYFDSRTNTYEEEVDYDYDRSYGIRFKKDSQGKFLDRIKYNLIEPFIDTTMQAIDSGQDGEYTNVMLDLFFDDELDEDEANRVIQEMLEAANKPPDEDMMRFMEIANNPDVSAIRSFFDAVTDGGVKTAYKVALSSFAGQAKAVYDSFSEGGEIIGLAATGAAAGAATASFGGGITMIGGGLRGGMSVVGGVIEASAILGELIREEFGGRVPNKEELIDLFNDKNKFNEMRKKSALKGGSIMLVDYIGGTAVAKGTFEVARKGGKVNKILAATGGTIADGGVGGFGEYVSGEIIDRPATRGDVMMEIIGSSGTGLVTDVTPSLIAAARTRYTITKPGGSKENITLQQLLGILESSTPGELARLDIEVVGDNVTKQRVENAKRRADIEVTIPPVVIDNIERQALTSLIIDKRRAQIKQEESQNKGNLEDPTLTNEIEQIDDAIESIMSEYKNIDKRTKPVREQKKDSQEYKKYRYQSEYDSRAEFLKAISEIYKVKVGDPKTDKEIKEIISQNPSMQGKGLEDAAGFYVPELNEVFLNLDKIAFTGNFTVDTHEALHAILKNAVDIDGNSLITPDLIADMEKTLGPDSWNVLKKRAEEINPKTGERYYTDDYMKQNPDEWFTFLSDAIQNNQIVFDKTMADGIKNILESIIGSYLTSRIPGLNRKVGFATGEEAVNFVRTYVESIDKGALNTSITDLIKDKKTKATDIKKSVVKPTEVNLEKSRSDLDKHITDDIKTQDDFKQKGARDKVFEEIYSNNVLDGVIRNRLIRDTRFGAVVSDENRIQNLIDDIKFRLLTKMDAQYKPVVDGNKRSIFSYFYGDASGRRGAIGFVIEDVAKAYKQTVRPSGSLEVQTDEGVRTIDVEDESTGLEAFEEEEVLTDQVKPTKDIVVADILGLSDEQKRLITKNIQEADLDITKLNYKNIKELLLKGPLLDILDIVSKEFGIETRRIQIKHDLNGKQRSSARDKIIEKSKEINLFDLLPEGQDPDGRATGVANTKFGEFYIKGGRVKVSEGATKGLGQKESQNKRKDVSNEEFLTVFGINEDGTIESGRKFDGALREFVVQIAQIIANQEIRKDASERGTATESQIVSIGRGKSEIVLSAGSFDIVKKYGQENTYFEIKTMDDAKRYVEEVVPLLIRVFEPHVGLLNPNEVTPRKGLSKEIKDYLKQEIPKKFEGITTKGNFPKRQFSDYVGKNNNEIIKNKNKISDYNAQAKINFETQWLAIDKALQDDPTLLGPIMMYLDLSQNSRTHINRAGAQYGGRDITAPGNMTLKLEHAVQNAYAYRFLIESSLIDKSSDRSGFKFDLKQLQKNYKLIAIRPTDDRKLDLSSYIDENGNKQSYKDGMGPGWNIYTDNWWQRYFNEDVVKTNGGLNPNNIVDENGVSLADKFKINSSGGSTLVKNSINDINADKNIIEAFNKQAEIIKKINQELQADLEKSGYKFSKGMSTFDFDETLIIDGENFVIATDPVTGETQRIKSGDWPIKGPELTEQGFTFNFNDFVNVRGGVEGPLLDKMRNQIKKYGPNNVFVLTARPQTADVAIHAWLRSKGINIPFKNITGLGDSRGDAKAEWMLEKFAEGYNDMYFVDDALPNVDAVKTVLDQLDIKSNIVQAKIKTSKGLSEDFNKMLERTKGVGAHKVFSKAEAKKRGINKGRYEFFVPPSAEDFKGLLYRFLGKGKQGEKDLQFFKDKLINPYSEGIKAFNTYKQGMAEQYAAIKKEYKNVSKNLNQNVAGTSFTNDAAIRVYLWNKAGFTIPGISKTLQNKLVKHVKQNPEMMAFADALSKIVKTDDVYVEPTESWYAQSIASDLKEVTQSIGLPQFLSEFIENKNEIFNEDNLNKIEATYGNPTRNALENILFRMENNTNRTTSADANVNLWLDWINGSVGATMFVNVRSAVLQTLSSVNFINWSDNNIFNAAKAFANQPQYWKDFAMIFNSDMLRQRRAGLSMDVASAELARVFANGGNTMYQKTQAVLSYLLQLGFTPTRVADSFAIASGGATFYRNRVNAYVKQGKSKADAEKQAFLDFQEIAEETQQSSRPDMIAQQQAGVLGRLILAWQNTPMQYTRLTKKALDDIVNNRGDRKTNVSKVIYYGAAQNILFGALQQGIAFTMFGGGIDEEDIQDAEIRVANGALDTFLRGTGIYGAAASTIKNTLIQWQAIQDKPYGRQDFTKISQAVIDISPPIGSKVRKITQASKTDLFNKNIYPKLKYRIENPKLSVYANVIEATTNVPLARLVNKANNIEEALDSNHQMWKRMALISGWNTWNLGIEDQEIIKAREEVRQDKLEQKKKEKAQQQITKEAIKESKKKSKVRCIALKRNAERCKNMTDNKNGKCYAHQ